MRPSRLAALTLATAALPVLLTGCAAAELDADDDVFAGLDPAVVAEVMDNPVAWGKVQDEDEETRASLAQGIVRNFIQCRGAFEAYRSWVTTGTTPAIPVVDAPSHPLEPAATAITQSQAHIEAAIASGDPAQVRDLLVGEARCGEWIPVEPGEPDGPTIEDAVEALG